MILTLSDGRTIHQDSAGHIITPVVPDEQFDIDNPDTWESDRAWLFAKVGKRIWTKEGIVTIIGISSS